ncbi:MAG: hypothetical protein ISS74_08275 [Planctomycetes bacterium]|nr:hypothetical protein [Planctomycetota bacterium]
MDPLIAGLMPIRRRLVLVRAAEAGLAGAFLAAALALAVTVLRIVAPQVLPVALAHPAVPLALVPCGFLAGFAVRLIAGASLSQAARAADRAAGLDERLATALEVLERTEGQGPVSGLGERLLADARRAAEGLVPGDGPLARTLGRRARAVLVAVVVLAGLALVPSLAGPPVARPQAERAAAALETAARDPAVAPAVREAIERAVDRLRDAGARRGSADAATAAVQQAVAGTQKARTQVVETLASADDAGLRQMVAAARRGDAAAAGAAAGDLVARTGADSASGGLTPAERDCVADALDAAAPAAREAGLADLERALADAADAVRTGDAGRAKPALDRLADVLVRSIGSEGEGGVAAAVEAVAQARRAVGLPPVPAEASAGTTPGEMPAAGTGTGIVIGTGAPGEGASGTGAADGVPDDVRPEDRDVVRRYFGG